CIIKSWANSIEYSVLAVFGKFLLNKYTFEAIATLPQYNSDALLFALLVEGHWFEFVFTA
ncbi:MAG: hypothetical protein ACK53Y_11190, partial [bacterium]